MMAEDSIRIERIKIKELVEFAKGMISSKDQEQLVPITLQRAIAHTHNPHADRDDIGLLVAYSRDECVGYFGILPIMLKHGEGFSKVYWFSTWFVSPKFRGRSIGSLLMEDALSMNQDYVIVGSGPARKVCQRFGFYEFDPLVYYSLDMSGMERLNLITWVLRFFRKILTPFGVKVRISNNISKFFERLASPLTKKLFYRWGFHVEKRTKNAFTYNEAENIDYHDLDLESNIPEVAFYRGAEVINWMLKYPWVVEPGQSLTEKKGFYFTDVREKYSNIAIEVSSAFSEEFIGFIILSYSIIGGKGVLKVLDIHFVNPDDLRGVFPIILRYGHEFNADKIEIPANLGAGNNNKFVQRFLLHQKQRFYQCYPDNDQSPLGKYWQKIELNYCDGDMPFT
jgi:GNAT superfamily N-acetyltransferase